MHLSLDGVEDGFGVDGRRESLFVFLVLDAGALGGEDAGGGEGSWGVDGDDGDDFFEEERDDDEGYDSALG